MRCEKVSLTRLLWATTILTIMVALNLISQPVLASSKPKWAGEGVYLLYGGFLFGEPVRIFGNEPINDEELESTLNKWRFANIREFGSELVEIKFVRADEEKAVYQIRGYGERINPGTKTLVCYWSDGKCIDLGLFGSNYALYININQIIRNLVYLKDKGFQCRDNQCVKEECYDNRCTTTIKYIVEIRETVFASRFGVLEIYDVVQKSVAVNKDPDRTRELDVDVFHVRIHKPTGIVIEIVRLVPINGSRTVDRLCWAGFLISLLDTNVPLGAKPLSPTQTTPQVSPTPVPTPVTPTTTPATPYTPTPTQVETAKTPSPTTPTQQPEAPDKLSGMVLPVVVAVLAIVTVVAVFKVSRK